MTTSDRIVAILIAVASLLIVVGFQAVMSPHVGHQGSAIVDSRGEPFP